jgi:hypothetical protein
MNDFDDDFLNNGFVDLGQILDKDACKELLKKVYETRNFGPDLFIEEKQHRENPRWKKNNPGPGINLTEKYDLDFIEKNSMFIDAMTKVLGPNYKIMLKKFIVGVPNDWLPEWVHNETKDQMIANLGAYIKPEYQDITYFRGIDFHQDLIDHKSRISDFITLYVYIDSVEMGMSPLVVIPKSHIFGATKFPHDLKMKWDSGKCDYSDREGRSKELDYKFLTGGVGQVYFWSALTLHGTQAQTADKPRISLRYLIERSSDNEEVLIDKLNESIESQLSLDSTRNDLDQLGKPVKFGKMLKS